jgi:RimJ/RimL family protein N-acetyltransferase
VDLTLRPTQEADLPLFYRWQDEEPQWERYTCRPVELVKPYPLFRARYLDALRSGREIVFSVLRDGELVGRMVAQDENPRNRSIEIGYYLARTARGQGVGSGVLPIFVGILFDWPGKNLHKLYATTSSGNAPSIAILAKSGFSLDGRLREHYLTDGEFSDQLYFSLLRREWETIRSGTGSL